MNTEIQSIHFKADQSLIDFVTLKISKLNTFYDQIISVKVFLKVENTTLKENKTVEIHLNVPDHNITKTQTSQSFEAATDLAIDSLKKQVKRFKGKTEGY